MGIEIERKFLVTDDSWRGQGIAQPFRQGYLARGKGLTVRVRIAGDRALLTIKSGRKGITRDEYEYDIPVTDAEEMLDRLADGAVIAKTRTFIEFRGKTWEVDEFHGLNEGLIVAEIELDDENEAFERPPWLGAEVSDDPRYLNSALSLSPYSTWS